MKTVSHWINGSLSTDKAAQVGEIFNPATGKISGTVNFADIASHPHMSREIGDIGWFTINEALGRIRSENVEKREILLRVSGIIRNYCCGMI